MRGTAITEEVRRAGPSFRRSRPETRSVERGPVDRRRLGRGDELEHASGRSAHRIGEGNAGDVAERVDLAGRILAESEQRERERAAWKHVQLADRLEVAWAASVHDEQAPV